jgi:hypothetical protein
METVDRPTMRAMTDDAQLAKWTRWIERPIYQGVIRMHFHRQIYRGVGEVIRENPSLPDSAYWRYHSDVYAETQAVAVRRQADRDRRVASLRRLIEEIRNEPSRLTWDRWLGLWGDERDGFVRGRWDHDFGGEVGEHIDPAIPTADLERLMSEAESVKAYVDTHIAHAEDFDRPQAPPRPSGFTPNDLDTAIDAIGELFRKYTDLLVVADVDLHVHLLPQWLGPFEVPWIRPSDRTA